MALDVVTKELTPIEKYRQLREQFYKRLGAEDYEQVWEDFKKANQQFVDENESLFDSDSIRSVIREISNRYPMSKPIKN